LQDLAEMPVKVEEEVDEVDQQIRHKLCFHAPV
jgi:hypothetical protein